MKSVVSYTLSHCQKCLKCLKVCPTEAITIVQERVHIDSRRCINCGLCIEACNTQGLQGKGSTLVDIHNYDFSVALLPSAIYSCCQTTQEAARLTEAIHRLGFDEVIDMSSMDAAITAKIQQDLKHNEKGPMISSFCPVVNRLIKLKYPMLMDRMMNINYPQEIAAYKIKERFKDKGKVGIFYFCECVSKLQLAKYPYGNHESNIDHAISIGDHFPQINRLKENEAESIELCKEGLMSASTHHRYDAKIQVLEADGTNEIMQVLELAEFGQLLQFDYLSLSYCTNGCIGGNLLWGNPFEAGLNLKNLLHDAHKEAESIEGINCSRTDESGVSDPLTIQQKLKIFSVINEVMEKLPHFDCGACGFASCRNMAEQIALGNRTIENCRIMENSEVKK